MLVCHRLDCIAGIATFASMASSIPLLVFAKVPEAGSVKTRLQTNCSAEQAADIAEILLNATLRQVTRHWPGKVILSCWPSDRHDTVKGLAARYGITTVAQAGGDLGEKMHAASEEFGYPVAIVGADVPGIEASCLSRTHKLLLEGQNVIGPSLDGGYYLIGLGQPEPRVFSDIQWGTNKVLKPTLRRARFSLLASMNDVDRWSDVLSISTKLSILEDYLRRHQLI